MSKKALFISLILTVVWISCQKKLFKTPRYSFEEGVYYFNTKDYRKADVIFHNLISNPFIEDENGILSLLLGISLLRMGKYTLAEKYLMETRFKTKYLEDYAHFFLANAFYKNEEYEEALETLDLLTIKFPDTAFICEALLLKSETSLKLGFLTEMEKALDTYKKKGCPLNAIYFIHKGELGYRKGNLEESKKSLLNAWLNFYGSEAQVEEKMKNIFGKENSLLSADLIETKMKKLAEINAFRDILRIYKKFNYRNSRILLYAGKAFYYTREFKKAIETLKKVTGDDKCEASFYIAKSYNRLRKIDKTIKTYKNLYQKFPKCEWADNALYKIALLKENDAPDILKEILKKFPESDILPLVLWKLAWYEITQRNYSDAEKYLVEILNSPTALEDEKARARFWLCEIKRRNRIENWIDFCKTSLNDTGLDYYTIATIYITKGTLKLETNKPKNTTPQMLNPKIELWKKAGVYEFVEREIRHIAKFYPQSLTSYLKAVVTDFPEMRKYLTHDEDPYFSFPIVHKEIVENTADMFSLDPYLLLALIKAESEFNRFAVSSAGARGLTQIIPPTAKIISAAMELKRFEINRLFEPRTSILMGGWYLKKLLSDFKAIVPALSAYNGGPINAKNWCYKWGNLPTIEFVEHIPFKETKSYVKNIISYYATYALLYRGTFELDKVFLNRACP